MAGVISTLAGGGNSPAIYQTTGHEEGLATAAVPVGF